MGVLALWLTASAQAAPPVSTHAASQALVLGDADLQPALVSDGQRFIAMQVGPQAVSVLDTRSHTTRTVAVPADCPMSAASHGQLALSCQPLLVDLASGVIRAVPGARMGAARTGAPGARIGAPAAGIGSPRARAGSPGPPDQFDAIGAQWLWGSGSDSHGQSVDVFVNWHTGARRTVGPHRNVADLAGPGLPSLDDPRLRTPRRCSPQWIYSSRGRTQVIAGLHGELVLQRCGQSARQGHVLDRCPGVPCQNVALVDGVVSWTRGSTAFAYLQAPAPARLRRWRLTGFAPRLPGESIEAGQAGRTLAVAVRTLSADRRVVYRFYAFTV